MNKQSFSLLSTEMILKHKEKGNIFIHPFNQEHLNSVSYDVSLGELFFRAKKFEGTLNSCDPQDIVKFWGNPERAILAKEWMDENGPLVNIKPEDRIIVLQPGEFILVHTIEFIGGRYCVTSEMRAKSSIGRIGITVCKCAGWGSLGFCNRWTMEMSNNLENPIILKVGMKVAQIIFYEVAPLTKSYVARNGKYQDTDDVEKMMKEWQPNLMLPKTS